MTESEVRGHDQHALGAGGAGAVVIMGTEKIDAVVHGSKESKAGRDQLKGQAAAARKAKRREREQRISDLKQAEYQSPGLVICDVCAAKFMDEKGLTKHQAGGEGSYCAKVRLCVCVWVSVFVCLFVCLFVWNAEMRISYPNPFKS